MFYNYTDDCPAPPLPCPPAPSFNPLRGFHPLPSRDTRRIIYLTPDEARLMLSAFDRETSVLANLMKIQRELKGGKAGVIQAIEEAMAQVAREVDLD